MRLLLALRALFFVLLLPGTVAGYIPFSILRAGNLLRVPDLGLASVCAAVFAITGALVLLRCVWDFFAAGKGTLAPIDPPRFLVVRGLYRFTRNPMYNRVIALILAVPVSLGIALFTTELAPRRLKGPITYVMDLLAAVPSVVYGLWGLLVLAPNLQPVYDALAGSIGTPALDSAL